MSYLVVNKHNQFLKILKVNTKVNSNSVNQLKAAFVDLDAADRFNTFDLAHYYALKLDCNVLSEN